MCNQIGNKTTGELHLRSYLLVNTVIHGPGFEAGRFFLEPRDVVGRKKAGENQVSLHFNLPDAFSQRQGCPVSLVDSGVLRFCCQTVSCGWALRQLHDKTCVQTPQPLRTSIAGGADPSVVLPASRQ